MEKKSIYECYEEIKQREIAELKARLKAFGGVAHFGPDYTGEYATGADCPIVMCNLNGFEPHPANVRIMSVGLSDDDRLTIMGCETSWCDDEMPIDSHDIAYGHIDFITSSIPVMKTKPYAKLSREMRLFCETVAMLSADLYENINERLPDSSAVCEEIVTLAQKFETSLDWEHTCYEKDYLEELDKFEKAYLESIKD